MKKTKVIGRHVAGPNHQVLTLASRHDTKFTYSRTPCAECPWRKDRPTGVFPAKAFRHSAATCADMAMTTFACHVSGQRKPTTCAGFLLSEDAPHNMILRLKERAGSYDHRQVSSPVELFPTYADMAIANGVRPNDPALLATRSRGGAVDLKRFRWR